MHALNECKQKSTFFRSAKFDFLDWIFWFLDRGNVHRSVFSLNIQQTLSKANCEKQIVTRVRRVLELRKRRFWKNVT